MTLNSVIAILCMSVSSSLRKWVTILPLKNEPAAVEMHFW